jgi:hypothetical protein
MPQNEYIELAQKRHGKRYDHEERKRKKEAREVHEKSAKAQKLHGLKAKLYNKKRHAEKVQMKKTYVGRLNEPQANCYILLLSCLGGCLSFGDARIMARWTLLCVFRRLHALSRCTIELRTDYVACTTPPCVEIGSYLKTRY